MKLQFYTTERWLAILGRIIHKDILLRLSTYPKIDFQKISTELQSRDAFAEELTENTRVYCQNHYRSPGHLSRVTEPTFQNIQFNFIRFRTSTRRKLSSAYTPLQHLSNEIERTVALDSTRLDTEEGEKREREREK